MLSAAVAEVASLCQLLAAAKMHQRLHIFTTLSLTEISFLNCRFSFELNSAYSFGFGSSSLSSVALARSRADDARPREVARRR